MDTSQSQQIPEAEGPPVTPHVGNRVAWSVNIGNVREAIRHCRPSVQQLLPDCVRWCLEHEISPAELVAAVGMDRSTLHRILNGTYVSPRDGSKLDLSDKHEQAMRSWLTEQRATIGSAIDKDEFVETPTAQKVFSAYHLARESRTPVFLWGPSQSGKSWALQYVAEKHNHGSSPLYRCSSVGGFYGFSRGIAEALNQTTRGNREQLKRDIIRALTPDMVLILDEFHELMHTARQDAFITCCEFVREIYDRVGLGVVLCLTNFGRDKLVAHRKADLEQMFRRGVHRITVGTESGQPLREDLEAILERNGLDFPGRDLTCAVGRITESPREVLCQLSRDEGLKAITERIRYARKFAGRDGRDQITWQDWTVAHLAILKAAQPAPDWR